MRKLIITLAAVLALPGCVRTIGTIVTAPVKVVSQGADWATTSQDEADRNHGREIRKQEERDARERRRAERERNRD